MLQISDGMTCNIEMSTQQLNSGDAHIHESAPPANIHGLLLLGGRSTRMRRDKAFLPYPITASPTADSPGSRTIPLCLHLLKLLRQACPGKVYISHNSAQKGRLQEQTLPDDVILVEDDAGLGDIGPATGILSVHRQAPTTSFLILATDFPLVTLETLTHLIDHHNYASNTSSITTYLHPSDHHPEPVLSVWTPAALSELEKNALGEKKKTGPCWTARQIWRDEGVPEGDGEDKKRMREGRGGVLPLEGKEWWLDNTNTPEEWERAVNSIGVRS